MSGGYPVNRVGRGSKNPGLAGRAKLSTKRFGGPHLQAVSPETRHFQRLGETRLVCSTE